MYLKIVINSLISICYVMSSKIGNYSQYIADYEKCGLSWNSLLMNTQCFENRYDFSPPLKEGRDALKGEVPWMVQVHYHEITWKVDVITSKCGGALLSDEWVLTAAHCMDHPKIGNYYVYTDLKSKAGAYIYANKVFIHPSYSGADTGFSYDLALIKLKKKIPMESTTDQQNIGTICLPSKSLSMNMHGHKFARTAGFGPAKSHLQISTYSVKRLFHTWDAPYQHLEMSSLIDSYQICDGDSGAPVWMYENGRAFMVGVISTGTERGICARSGTGTFVPDYIDWILKTMVDH